MVFHSFLRFAATSTFLVSSAVLLPCINPKLSFERDTALFSGFPGHKSSKTSRLQKQLRCTYMSSCKSNPSNGATSDQEIENPRFPFGGWRGRERAASDISGRTLSIPSLSIYRPPAALRFHSTAALRGSCSSRVTAASQSY